VYSEDDPKFISCNSDEHLISRTSNLEFLVRSLEETEEFSTEQKEFNEAEDKSRKLERGPNRLLIKYYCNLTVTFRRFSIYSLSTV